MARTKTTTANNTTTNANAATTGYSKAGTAHALGSLMGVSVASQGVQIHSAQKGAWPSFRAAFIAVPKNERADWALGFVEGFESVKGAKDGKTRKLMMMARDYAANAEAAEALGEMPEAQGEAILWCRGQAEKPEATPENLIAMAVKFLAAAQERGASKKDVQAALKAEGLI